MAADKATSEIRVVKRGRGGHGGHHGGAWKVAYADFVTAMMAFFLVMWIVGLSSSVKEAIAGYFKDPVGFMAAAKAGKAPFGLDGLDTGGPGKANTMAPEERNSFEKTKDAIERMLAGSPDLKELKKYVEVKLVGEGLEIDLLEARESLFFDSGSANVKPATRHLLALVAKELGKLPNRIIIEGHTDSRPLARSDGYSNWELSADRANAARQIMQPAGIREKQIDQVRGYAATHPRMPDNPEHFSNRRVSIIVVMKNASTRMVDDLAGVRKAATGGVESSSSSKGSKPALDKTNPIGIDKSFGGVTKH